MKKERESFFNKTLKEIGDEVLDKLVGLVVRPEKPERVDRLTFAGLMSRATLLAEKHPNGKDCKCIICKDSEGSIFEAYIIAPSILKTVISLKFSFICCSFVLA